MGSLASPKMETFSLALTSFDIVYPSAGNSGLGFRLTLVATPHYGRYQPRIQTEILGHSLVRLLAPLTRSHYVEQRAPFCLVSYERGCNYVQSTIKLAHFDSHPLSTL